MILYIRFYSERRQLSFRLERFRKNLHLIEDDYLSESYWIAFEWGSQEYATFVELMCQLDMEFYEMSMEEMYDYGFLDDPILESHNFLPNRCNLLSGLDWDGTLRNTNGSVSIFDDVDE